MQNEMFSKPYEIPLYKVTLVREKGVNLDTPKITSSSEVMKLVQDFLSDVDREHFIVIMLDRKNKIIGMNIVSVGSVSASVVHPREVWKPAILSNASAVILAHNHPSGDPKPSQEDKNLTNLLVQGGKILGINVLDHVIIGDGTSDWYSFADNGILE